MSIKCISVGPMQQARDNAPGDGRLAPSHVVYTVSQKTLPSSSSVIIQSEISEL